MREIETDYLVIGAGAAGMAFVEARQRSTSSERSAETGGLLDDLSMGETEPAATGQGDQPAAEPDVSDEAREAALTRQVQRMQQKHREGGVEPELSDGLSDSESGA